MESYKVSSLLKGRATGRFTHVEITLGFFKRAAIAQFVICDV